MRLVTFDTPQLGPRAGLLVENRVVEIHSDGIPPTVRGILAEGERCLDQIRRFESRSGLALDAVHLGPPIPDPQKIICVGQNYRDHCLEQNAPIPKSPIIFTKFVTSLNGPRDNIVLPRVSEQIDYEIELAFVIGKGGKHISEERALEHVAGYMVFNDVTARDIQFGDKQWVRGKSCDTFAPCGPALVTRDEIADPQNLKLEMNLNGEVMQSSNTSQMIFGVAYLISFLSRTITWTPGDIVATGTPPGVGVFRKPPVFLKPGDKLVAAVETLGSLENACVAD
jgi:2-keto-4-pentenoate hydratase/2-oxohepta-3-ene-1,7-dioic acid hydratase in catechol pathway